MADGAPLTFHKVDALPPVLEPDAFYVLKETVGQMSIVVAGADGTAYLLPRSALHMAFGSTGRPAADAQFGRYLVAETLDLSATLSRAIAQVAATADAVVRVLRGAELVATMTFAAAAGVATVAILVPTVDPGDVLVFRSPLVQDATLSGIDGTLVGLRRT